MLGCLEHPTAVPLSRPIPLTGYRNQRVQLRLVRISLPSTDLDTLSTVAARVRRCSLPVKSKRLRQLDARLIIFFILQMHVMSIRNVRAAEGIEKSTSRSSATMGTSSGEPNSG